MPAYENSQEELRMEDWDKNAFEFFPTRTDDERSNSLDVVDDQTRIADQQMSRSRRDDIALDEIMQSQVQQTLLQQTTNL
ncbi:hypothetical protein BH10CYA1_BH10CYA1_55960 [soil metagenome]